MARKSVSPITFVLRDPKSIVPTPIIGVIRFNNTRVKISTGFKVLPENWDSSKYRVRQKLTASNRTQVNSFIANLEHQVEEIINNIKSTRQSINKELLKKELSLFLEPTKEEVAETNLFSFISEFIETAPERINLNSGKYVQHKTIQKYNTVFNLLKDFASVYNRTLNFDTIDLEFYNDFTAYLTKNRNFSVNNIGKYTQTIKVFLNEAESRGFKLNQDYKNRRFKVLQEDSDSIYLKETELAILNNLDLTQNPRLERVRDLFLIGSYTGLRFSDLINIRPESIRNGYIRLEQLKTMDKVVIPCHPIVSSLIEKYNGDLPRSISNQKMNDYIKEVAKAAGLTSKVSKSITKGGKRLTNFYEQYKLISTHTARRSFATNMYHMGIPSITIMKITGHRTEKAFLRYIKLSQQEHAEIIQKHWQEKYDNNL